MKKFHLIFPLLAVLLLSASCIRQDDFRFLGVEGATMHGLTRADVLVRIENRSSRNVTLQDARLHVFNEGAEVCEIRLRNEVVIPKRSSEAICLPLQLRVSDPLALYGLIKSLSGKSIGHLTVSGSGTVKSGRLKKGFEMGERPLSDFASLFGGLSETFQKSVAL